MNSTQKPTKTRIYTRTGDKGQTSLVNGTRVLKSNARVETYGTIDELNAAIGVTRSFLQDEMIDHWLETIQRDLFNIGSTLATPSEKQIPDRVHIPLAESLEQLIDKCDEELPALTNFILPGGTKAGATLHLARTICRRAERRLVTLTEQEPVNPEILRYINRLADLLFSLARLENYRRGIEEVQWA
ncbi:MAG: cob(I)yrinic acid a,c-diamide adenosyltransferase [Candidatus Hodarchaeales archaeon]